MTNPRKKMGQGGGKRIDKSKEEEDQYEDEALNNQLQQTVQAIILSHFNNVRTTKTVTIIVYALGYPRGRKLRF
jgi:hypothetical protein